jgi:hypothetical protein
LRFRPKQIGHRQAAEAKRAHAQKISARLSIAKTGVPGAWYRDHHTSLTEKGINPGES